MRNPQLRTRVAISALTVLFAVDAAAQGQPVDNFSAFAETSVTDRSLPSPTLQRLLDGGLRVPMEVVTGQPTVLPIGPGWLTPAINPHKRPEVAARHALMQLGHLYRLSPHVVAGFDARIAHDTGFGGIIVTFRQSVGGVEVHGHRMSVLLERGTLEPTAIAGYLFAGYTRDEAPGGRLAFQVPKKAAIQVAIADRHGVGVDPGSVLFTGRSEAPYAYYALSSSGARTIGRAATVEPVRIKPVYYGLSTGLVPAWYLELISSDTGAAPTTWAYVISARDGLLLERTSLNFDYEYSVYADDEGWPLDSPLGTTLSPLQVGTSPDALMVYVDPVVVDVATGYNQHGDPWLAEGTTVTSGNNVDAYADLNAPDGFSDGDLRGRVSDDEFFGFLFDPTLEPESSEMQRLASIQHHFYVINFLHDTFYDHGFDEASGTAQVDNYGRGGREGDPILAQSHDFGGTNNANMSTPADGASPRMQMYIWNRGQTASLTVGDADPITTLGTATFGPPNFEVTGTTELVDDGVNPGSDGCTALQNDHSGKIALIDRGACTFWEKIYNAQQAGAIGVIVMNNRDGAANNMGGTPGQEINIASVHVTQAQGAQLRGDDLGMVARLERILPVKRPGSVDTTIVAHEWGHYLFGRLAAGQGSLQARGINEGTADFVAQIMSVRAEDVEAPGNDEWQGAYPALLYSAYSLGGIRRVAYSTDPAVNGLTLLHISNGVNIDGDFEFNDNGAPNSEVHNTGEVWATIMWEVFAGLLRQHEFVEARSRMIDYLVAALKMVPPNATFVEQRDAVIAAMAAADTDDVRIAWQAFARRGLGTGAVAPPRNSGDNVGVTESFELRKDLAVVDIRLNDGLQNCDDDGFLDAGELGTLEVDIVNGAVDLDDAEVTVIADRDISFPMGATISVPVVAPGGRTTVEIPVRLDAMANVSLVNFSVTVTAADLLNPPSRNRVFDARVNADEARDAARTDDVEATASAWTVTYDDALTEPTLFARREISLAAHDWFTPDFGAGRSDQSLVSPELNVSADGDFVVAFDHKYQFETTNNVHYDAAVLEITNDGGETWVDAGNLTETGYNGQVTDLGGNNRNPLFDRQAWVDKNPSYPNADRVTVNLGAQFAGDTVQIRFRMGTDPAVGGEGWSLDNFAVEGIDNTPFTALSEDAADCPDTPPVADAGTDAVVPEGNLGRLNGAASADPWGRTLSYAWTQVDGPRVTLAGANSAAPSFTAPDVVIDTRLTFALTVRTDDGRTSAADQVVILVQRINQVPVADAGDDGALDEGDSFTLDGTGSTDPDGDDLSYLWAQIGGPVAALSDSESPTPSFVAPDVNVDTVLTFQLRVSDGMALSPADQVEVTVSRVNRRPVSNAGPDQTVRVRTEVTLDGTASSDPDGDAIERYRWEQTGGPEVELDNVAAAQPRFQSPYVHTDTNLQFTLVVADASLTSEADSVTIRVLAGNDPPVAHAGEDAELNEGQAHQLDGTRSSDPDSDDLSFRWVQLSGPAAVLSSPAQESPTFTAPEVRADATLVFELVVSDGQALSEPDTVSVLVRQVNQPPTADAGDDRAVPSSGDVTLDGSDSEDPDGDDLTFAWSQTDGPEVELVDAETAAPSFVAPEVAEDTTLRFALVVSDGAVSSEPDTVEILVIQGNQPPVADAGDDLEVPAGAEVRLNGNGSRDPDGDALTAAWTQGDGPEVTLAGADTLRPTFTAPAVQEDTTLTFALVVSDGVFTSEADTVEVRILAPNGAPIADAGPRQEVDEGAIAQLDGTASSDPEGEALTFSWTQIAGPPAVFSGNGPTPDVATPAVSEDATMTFQLVVSDGRSLGEPATVEVLVRNLNQPPVAVAGDDLTVEEGATVRLDGSGSRDPDGGTLQVAWSPTDGEPVVELDPADALKTTFLAPTPSEEETKLTFRLTVMDAAGEVATDDVVVTVTRRPSVSVDSSPEGGCGCSTAAPPARLTAVPLLALGLVGFLVVRRRF